MFRTGAGSTAFLLAVMPSAFAACGAVEVGGPMAVTEVGDVTDARVTADGSRLVYRADQETDEVFELFSAPVDGSSAPVKLSHALLAGADVEFFEIGAGDRVVYTVALPGVPAGAGLFSVPADGSAAATVLFGPVEVRDLALGAGGTFAVLRVIADRLFSVPVDGAPGAVELAQDVDEHWVNSSASVVFRRDGALHSVPIDGSAPAQ